MRPKAKTVIPKKRAPKTSTRQQKMAERVNNHVVKAAEILMQLLRSGALAAPQVKHASTIKKKTSKVASKGKVAKQSKGKKRKTRLSPQSDHPVNDND